MQANDFIPKRMKDTTLIVVGAGPAGLAVGIEAAKAGLDYWIVDKGNVVHSIYRFPEFMTFFSTAEKLTLAGLPFPSVRQRPTRQEALEYYRLVAEYFQLKIRPYERVTAIDANGGRFYIDTEKQRYRSRFVVVATGFYDQPNLLEVPGEELPHVQHYYRSPYPYYGRRVVIVGGGNSAVQAALECWQRGARVTMVVRDEDFHRSVKYWLLPDIRNRIQEGSIAALFNAQVREIRAEAVIVDQDGRSLAIAADHVLALTGYRPDYAFLEGIGLQFEGVHRVPVHDPETLESNVANLYLAGSVLGGLHTSRYFIENTRHHGKLIVEDITRKMKGMK